MTKQINGFTVTSAAGNRRLVKVIDKRRCGGVRTPPHRRHPNDDFARTSALASVRKLRRRRAAYVAFEDFLPDDFLAAFLVDFLAGDFLVVFFADDFLDEDFFAVDFLGDRFFAADFRVFFAADFFVVFREARRGFGGTLSPSRRASDRAMAIACLRLFTFLCEPPLRSFPSLRSRITLRTFACVFLPYFAIASSLGRALARAASVTELPA